MNLDRMLWSIAILLTVTALGVSSIGCSSATDETTTSPPPDTAENSVTGECKVEGFDCSKAGARCTKKCFEASGAPDVQVVFVVDGKTLDSRAIPFAPVETDDGALRYGCGLWTAADGAQGLQVLYKKNGTTKGDFTDDTLVRIDDFNGPGRYKAAGRYIASTDDLAQMKAYAKRDGCTVDVTASPAGLKGTVACDSLPRSDGDTVKVTGEFVCPGSALSPIYSRLP